MKVLRLLFENLRKGTISFRLPHKHQCTSDRYRGLIHNDAERCVGCGQCAYACPSGCMEVHRDGDKYTWSYDPSKCTFCGRCIERCKPHTLSMESSLPPLYSIAGEMKEVLNMVKKKPVRPPVQAVVAKVEVPADQTVTGNAEAKPAPTVGDGEKQPVPFVKAVETPAV